MINAYQQKGQDLLFAFILYHFFLFRIGLDTHVWLPKIFSIEKS